MSSHVNSCHGDYPFISHIVSSGVHMCCPVKPWNAMSSHDKPCQVMSWRLSPHFSYCQLRCVLCGDFPLVSHIVSSGVHFVAIFPSFLILSAQVCTCVVLSSHETPCQVMTIHVKSCQIMSWQLSPCFSYCQLRCALQPKKKDKTQNRSSTE